jgi:hypothetical protein
VRLIAQRTRVALASKKAAGAKLGTPTNIILAGEAGRRVQPPRLTGSPRRYGPLTAEIQAAGLVDFGSIAAV